MSNVEEFFRGKHIFITGGSGFIGKILIEKLLRSCGGIEKIYVLVRAKRNQSPEERLSKIVDGPLFDKLREINPQALKKLIPVSGDASELNLGLNKKDEQTIIENVDLIYHAAASVRFDDHLKYSVLLNTRGTREAVTLGLKAKKKVTFIHISTTYCNCDKKHTEEKLYPAHADWRKTITLAEEADEQTLEVLSQKYIHPLPNTYTFAKSLAERTVNDMCKGKLLAGIVRPSIVIPTLEDPIPGWTDNFNGPVGLLAAGGKGIVRTVYLDESVVMNFIPVDAVVKLIILATYETAVSRELNEVPVYNASNVAKTGITYKDLVGMGLKLTWSTPYHKMLWYPSAYITNHYFVYLITFLLFQFLPAIFFDGIMKLCGKKPMLTKTQRKVYIANTSLIYFMQHEWTFANDKCLALRKHIKYSEGHPFSIENCFTILPNTKESESYYRNAKIGASEFLFNEKFDKEKGYRNTMILWVMHIILQLLVYGGLYWFLIYKIKILTILNGFINRYYIYLYNL